MDAPDNLWAEIEKEEIRRSGKQPKPTFLWVKRLSAVAAAAAVVLLTAYYIFTPIDNVDNITIPPNTEKNGGRGIYAQHTHIQEKQDLPDHTVLSKPAAVTMSERIVKQESSPDDACDLTIANENAPRQPERMAKDTLTNTRLLHDDLPSKRNYSKLIASNSGNTNSRFSVALYSSGGINSNVRHKSAGGVMASAGSDNAVWKDSPRLGILLFNHGMETTTDIKHHQPIKAGVSFAYKLNERLRLGTGISYTNLTSDFHSGSESHYFTKQQVLHYIGMPLNVSYDVFQWKRLNLYASAGILAEKCVSSKVTTDFIVDNAKSETETGGLHTKPFQISANASAGIQLSITDMVGIYAEPGLSYYFDDGTDIETIYKDKPLNLNFNFGLRFTIH